MKQLSKIMVLFAAIFVICACAPKSSLKFEYNTGAASNIRYPEAFFAVISDVHIYDPALGSSGSAFEKVMNSDRKLLLDSMDLLDFAIDNIIASGVSFVLISGDLTKDGELINHRIIAEKLSRFTDANIKTYVVPGNHDINNPEALKFSGDNTERVASVSMDDFARIYDNFGFGSALMRDDNSLSYVCEPVDGMWLLAIDACRYRENDPEHHPLVSGKLNQQTADWIAAVLKEANSKNKAVMVLMHHGVVEHWKGQSKLHPDYLVDDYLNFGKFLASWSVKVAFTGHYHAQDVVRAVFGGNFIYDIETGSLVTAPCPMRFIEIKDNSMNIRTETIVDRLHPGTVFSANANAFVKRTVMLEAANTLRKYKVSEKDIDIISNAVGDAFAAHYSGDEDASGRPPLDKSKLGLWGRFVLSQQQYVLDGLWADIYPQDNNVRLQLAD